MGQLIFITGTDTGAGKTLLAALLLTHLRATGCCALATKPFCSGSRRDAKILARALDHQIPIERINPYFFPEPVAPLIGARQARRRISLARVVEHIRALASECDLLLVEGAGGLFVPLGSDYTVADLIRTLRCPVLVAARNKLGVVNHALLTLAALGPLRVGRPKLILMNGPGRSLAVRTNAHLISASAPPRTVYELPYLGLQPDKGPALHAAGKKLKKTLAAILRRDTLSTALQKSGGLKPGR